MAVVKINAIEVAEGSGAELEKRFAHRMHSVDSASGFLGFELLRPVSGDSRYFVYTRWTTEEAYQAWASGPAIEAHAGVRANPVSTGASLLEFEVVLSVDGAGNSG
jgi:heme oxygenase (mycobilin-producing)